MVNDKRRHRRGRFIIDLERVTRPRPFNSGIENHSTPPSTSQTWCAAYPTPPLWACRWREESVPCHDLHAHRIHGRAHLMVSWWVVLSCHQPVYNGGTAIFFHAAARVSGVVTPMRVFLVASWASSSPLLSSKLHPSCCWHHLSGCSIFSRTWSSLQLTPWASDIILQTHQVSDPHFHCTYPRSSPKHSVVVQATHHQPNWQSHILSLPA
jgi:hypothetical protein